MPSYSPYITLQTVHGVASMDKVVECSLTSKLGEKHLGKIEKGGPKLGKKEKKMEMKGKNWEEKANIKKILSPCPLTGTAGYDILSAEACLKPKVWLAILKVEIQFWHISKNSPIPLNYFTWECINICHGKESLSSFLSQKRVQ